MMRGNDNVRTAARGTRPDGFKSLALGMAMLLGAAGAARAGTVNLNYMSNGSGRVVHVSLGSQSWNVFAGRLIHSTSGMSGSLVGLPLNITTFCVDILQSHTSGPSMYASSSVAGLSGNTGLTNLGFAKQHAIYDIYQAAGNRQFTAGLDYATAFQVALWEVVYDFNATLPNHGLNVASGAFRVTAPGQSALSVSIASKVQYLLASVGIGAASHGLIGLRSGSYQDQLFAPDSLVVPLPLAAWPALGGLGLVAVTGWRRRACVRSA